MIHRPCTCDDGRKPRCQECERRAEAWRCMAALRSAYPDANVWEAGWFGMAALPDGRLFRAHWDYDCDRVRMVQV